MTPRGSDAAERILREAMRLFAERGYERTSVPEIQDAAGLTRGSGAMYKHYRSKEAVLRAGVDAFIAESKQTRATLRDLKLPPGETLAWIARRTLESLDGRRGELRIVWRDLEQFPSLQAKVRREIMQASYRAIAAWLHDQAGKGEIREHDSDAVAGVILGSLTMFKVFEALWGEKAIAVDDERFIAAWSDLVPRGLGLSAPSPAKPTAPRKGAGSKAQTPGIAGAKRTRKVHKTDRPAAAPMRRKRE